SEALLKLEEEKQCSFLTMKSGFERALWILAGGPAAGKRSIFNTKVKKQVVRKQPAPGDLLEALRNGSKNEQEIAGSLSPSPEVVGELMELMQDKDEAVRQKA